MNIFKELRADLKNHCFTICPDPEVWSHATLEAPKDPLNGDLSTNAAMVLATKVQKNPREIAMSLKEELEKNSLPQEFIGM